MASALNSAAPISLLDEMPLSVQIAVRSGRLVMLADLDPAARVQVEAVLERAEAAGNVRPVDPARLQRPN